MAMFFCHFYYLVDIVLDKKKFKVPKPMKYTVTFRTLVLFLGAKTKDSDQSY